MVVSTTGAGDDGESGTADLVLNGIISSRGREVLRHRAGADTGSEHEAGEPVASRCDRMTRDHIQEV